MIKYFRKDLILFDFFSKWHLTKKLVKPLRGQYVENWIPTITTNGVVWWKFSCKVVTSGERFIALILDPLMNVKVGQTVSKWLELFLYWYYQKYTVFMLSRLRWETRHRYVLHWRICMRGRKTKLLLHIWFNIKTWEPSLKKKRFQMSIK